tara:strand:- start:6213 stop:6434 length:222 start_codon:yes stop_codon:yes gene_type:complete
MKYDHIHSVEQLGLLQQYIVISSLILGLPGVNLYLKKDYRWSIAIILFFTSILVLVYLYSSGNKILFPDVTIT